MCSKNYQLYKGKCYTAIEIYYYKIGGLVLASCLGTVAFFFFAILTKKLLKRINRIKVQI